MGTNSKLNCQRWPTSKMVWSIGDLYWDCVNFHQCSRTSVKAVRLRLKAHQFSSNFRTAPQSVSSRLSIHSSSICHPFTAAMDCIISHVRSEHLSTSLKSDSTRIRSGEHMAMRALWLEERPFITVESERNTFRCFFYQVHEYYTSKTQLWVWQASISRHVSGLSPQLWISTLMRDHPSWYFCCIFWRSSAVHNWDLTLWKLTFRPSSTAKSSCASRMASWWSKGMTNGVSCRGEAK